MTAEDEDDRKVLQNAMKSMRDREPRRDRSSSPDPSATDFAGSMLHKSLTANRRQIGAMHKFRNQLSRTYTGSVSSSSNQQDQFHQVVELNLIRLEKTLMEIKTGMSQMQNEVNLIKQKVNIEEIKK